jgi:UDP-glucose 4-epimerase
MTKTVIVTGAAGYIGGAICIELITKGYYVIGIDRRALPSHLEIYCDEFIQSDFIGYGSLMQVERQPCAIIHCAGTSLVGPSIQNPEEYYENNIQKTLAFLKYIRRRSPNSKFIFSSSASVYGNPDTDKPITEEQPTNPISPYGESKLMIDKALHSFNIAYGMKYVAFRYFNACGAIQNGIHGQEANATHIFPKVFDAILENQPFILNGSDYNTKDGTCVRDYIHIADIANAHVMAIEKNMQGIYNIGSVRGYSNLEILKEVSKCLGKNVSIEVAEKRIGDPAYLIADSDKLFSETGWTARKDLRTIIKDLHDWYFPEALGAHPS